MIDYHLKQPAFIIKFSQTTTSQQDHQLFRGNIDKLHDKLRQIKILYCMVVRSKNNTTNYMYCSTCIHISSVLPYRMYVHKYFPTIIKQ